MGQGTESPGLERITAAVIAGDMAGCASATEEALAAGIEAKFVMDRALIPAMSVVGDRFEKKEYFVPEVLVSARAMDASLALLRPLLEAGNVEPLGRVAVGTVAGDLHDIGKNIVAMVLTGAGLEVENLGTDVPASAFADAAERGVQVIGMSSLLTTTRPVMAQVVTVLEERGLRDRVKVVIGGAAVTDRFATQIGADAFGADATDAVRVVKRLLGV
jgi:5-methyltetrahydrofolate--homocysteine methyltransferase